MHYHLQSPYENLLETNNWEKYIDLLCKEGLFWWLNFDVIQIANHLAPLSEFSSTIRKPDRLKILYEVVNPDTSQEKIKSLYSLFFKQQDYFAAIACIVAGWSNVWNSGVDLKQMNTWESAIREVTDTGIQLSTIEQAAVLTANGSIELMLRGNIHKVENTLRKALILAEQAEAFSLKIYIAYIYGHSLIWQGDLKKIEVLDFDIAPLCQKEEMALIPVVAYQAMKSFYFLLVGDVSQSITVLNKIIGHDLFDLFPPSIWLLTYGNLLLANAYDGNDNEVHRISEIIQNRAVPEQNNFHHGYAHFSLGTAALITGDLYKAKLHAIEGANRSRICSAPIVERVCALLMGQILLDSGEYHDAERHLKKWIGRLHKKGNILLAGQGTLELAELKCKIDDYTAARKYYDNARELLPQFKLIPNPHRGPSFTKNLEQKLNQYNASQCVTKGKRETAIFISTFGNLKIQAGHQIIVDNGRNNRVLSMLKAIIASGGSDVSIRWLMDALWPDLEGDRAYSAFKVTLFRLRRIVCTPKQKPPPWIVLREKKLSISDSLCSVDSFIFQNKIKTSEAEIDDIHEQAEVLDLYKSDFLSIDDHLPWVVHHRNKVRQIYLEGVMALADKCLNSHNPEPALLYLKQALEFDNLNEKIYAFLMKTYLKMGLPSQAINTYRGAEKVLVDNLNITPGNLLIELNKKAHTSI
jgi:two-component SAPR family response regulator